MAAELLVTFLIFLHCAQTAQALSLNVEVEPKSATVTWTTSNEISGTITSNRANFTSMWQSTNQDSQMRRFNDLKENTIYRVCITENNISEVTNQSKGETICEEFQTPFTMRSIAAFSCAGFLLLSFCILTVLDLVFGSIGPDANKKKQEELLEEGYKTFKKTAKAKGKAAHQKKKKKRTSKSDDDVGDRNGDVVDGDEVEDNEVEDTAIAERYSLPDTKESEMEEMQNIAINQWLESGTGMPPTFGEEQKRSSTAGSSQDGDNIEAQRPKVKAVVSFETGI